MIVSDLNPFSEENQTKAGVTTNCKRLVFVQMQIIFDINQQIRLQRQINDIS